MSGAQGRRETLLRLFEAAVAAAHPAGCLKPHLPVPPERGRLIVLAAGKAGASMAAVAERHYRERGLGPDRLTGLAVTRHGYAESAGLIPVIEAGHPVPDRTGVEATERTLALAGEATADDLVLVLLSGGGSANWIAPAGRLTLEEKQGITRALLRSGAAIGEINTVRKHLSRIKGGRLAEVAAPARVVTLAISDVPFDDPAVIASGPTVPDPSTLAEARAIIERRGVPLPPSAAALLDSGLSESPKPGNPVFEHTAFRIVIRPADAIAAAAKAAADAGYDVVDLGADVEGEAREVAADHARMTKEAQASGRRVAIVSGGELTVTIRDKDGEGRGGPNQEYALALAIALDGAPGIAALAADTDGIDGGAGSADDPAGAVVDETTLVRARALDLDPATLLADNDSTNFFARLGDLVACGPTRTNVNDCRIILVG